MHNFVRDRDLPRHDPIVIVDGFTLIDNQNRPVLGGDLDKIWAGAGTHQEDGGFVARTTDGLVCTRCNAEVAIPVDTRTYSDLEQLSPDQIRVVTPPKGTPTMKVSQSGILTV